MENLDKTVAPAANFYQFACGGWMKAHPLTDEYGRFGSFDLLAENNAKQLKGLIEGLAAHSSTTEGVGRKVGDLYNIAMDSVKLNADGAAPVKPLLDRVTAVKSRKELPAMVAEMTREGLGAYFGIYIGADDMNSSMNLAQFYLGFS